MSINDQTHHAQVYTFFIEHLIFVSIHQLDMKIHQNKYMYAVDVKQHC